MVTERLEIWPHTGAILCGGKSIRMGTPKAIIKLSSGITIIEHVYRALRVICKEVVLVGSPKSIPNSLRHLRCLQDNHRELGPIGGLEALLSSGLDSEYLISSCDLFRVTSDLFSLLLHPDVRLPAVLSIQKRIEPLIGRYPTALLPVLRKNIAQGKFAMTNLVKEAHATLIPVPREHARALSNANTPEDLAK